jgi:hypothetical protein
MRGLLSQKGKKTLAGTTGVTRLNGERPQFSIGVEGVNNLLFTNHKLNPQNGYISSINTTLNHVRLIK